MDEQLSQIQALDLWRRTVVIGARCQEADLTTRQMAVLLTVYLVPQPHTVRGLARALQISKPAVTRGLDRLSKLDLVRRQVDQGDRRSILVQRTDKGAEFLSQYGEIITAAARQLVRN